MMNVADRIQNLRKTKGISQEQLADAIGVSRQAVSKWESEQCTPDLDKVILMSEYFDVTTDYILKGIEPVAGDGHVTVGDVLDKKILTEANGNGQSTSFDMFCMGRQQCWPLILFPLFCM